MLEWLRGVFRGGDGGPKCSVCGYKVPSELAGGIFMGPGGLHQCPKCGKAFCNEHAKRVPLGDTVVLLNCPNCDERLAPI